MKREGPRPAGRPGTGQKTDQQEHDSKSRQEAATPLGWRREDVAGRVWFYRRVTPGTGLTGPVRVELRITNNYGNTLERTIVCVSSHRSREQFIARAAQFNSGPLRSWEFEAVCEAILLDIADELDSAGADEGRARQ